MRRFWTVVTVEPANGGWGIALDGRCVRTPARAELVVPGEALAEAIADEWRACGETVDPRAMPLTGLANAALDRVAPAAEKFAADLARYGDSDLLCYRADHPPSLVAAQAAAWDPLLDWARRFYDVDFEVTAGILHRPQPTATVRRLAAAVATYDPLRLAALSPLVTIGGSLVAALALVEGAASLDTFWAATSLDEQYQLDHWGRDAEAEALLTGRRRDIDAAWRLLELSLVRA